ncbi:mediator of RNA polymerase II transcription subunit 1-like isoform X2 [Heteronotia binoei]|uniref:mediator of RNA polymerase II transcription subunit 1-like isoform X2 n=1 Tax=Heteronotia binoei TaxID=13085 RepID=UPI00292F04F1|nr:mediator of RNA polymerase II transcription subunit 1-like isoform X2 [Heteronotia binoei]
MAVSLFIKEKEKGLQEINSFEPISTAALMARLHLKFSQRSWSGTENLVRAYMDRPKTRSTTSKHSISSCLEKLQRAINAEPLFAVTRKLELLSKQKRLNCHTSPNGTAFYITTEMFYIEIQLKADGEPIEIKLAHPGESPQNCEDLLQVLRKKDYDTFGKILEELLSIYQIPGSSKTKAKVFLALQSLERDITSLSLLPRALDTERTTKILHGKIGYLRPRTAETPMSLEFYLSPMQILEEQLTPGLQVPGMKVFVTIGGSDVAYKLPIYPLIGNSLTETDSQPVFLPLTAKLCMKFSACFFLKFHPPFPVSSSNIEKLQKLTGIAIDGLNLAPLHELIVQHALSEKHKYNPAVNNFFVVCLPDCPKHCYYINNGTGASCLTGAVVSKLPFTHLQYVPDIIEVLRHQAAYNTLVSSCISGIANSEVSSELLHFEVCPVKANSFSVTFQQPGEENLACVLIDVPSSKEVICTLYTLSKDKVLNGIEEFFNRVLKRCMSVPIFMRTVFKKAFKLQSNEAVQGMEETSEQSPQEASKMADMDGSGAILQNTGLDWESWSPDILESLPDPGFLASLSEAMDITFAEPLDDRTEANSSSSSLPPLEPLDDRSEANSSSSSLPPLEPLDDRTEANSSSSSLPPLEPLDDRTEANSSSSSLPPLEPMDDRTEANSSSSSLPPLEPLDDRTEANSSASSLPPLESLDDRSEANSSASSLPPLEPLDDRTEANSSASSLPPLEPLDDRTEANSSASSLPPLEPLDDRSEANSSASSLPPLEPLDDRSEGNSSASSLPPLEPLDDRSEANSSASSLPPLEPLDDRSEANSSASSLPPLEPLDDRSEANSSASSLPPLEPLDDRSEANSSASSLPPLEPLDDRSEANSSASSLPPLEPLDDRSEANSSASSLPPLEPLDDRSEANSSASSLPPLEPLDDRSEANSSASSLPPLEPLDDRSEANSSSSSLPPLEPLDDRTEANI